MHEAVSVRAGIRTLGTIDIQGVDGWHSRFETWLRPFSGVASGSLANDTGWQRVLDAAALTTPQQCLRVAVAPSQWRRPMSGTARETVPYSLAILTYREQRHDKGYDESQTR